MKLPHGAGFGGENICKAEDAGRISCWNWGEVSREKKDDEAWAESFAVVYTRVRP